MASNILVSSSVFAAPSVATYKSSASHKKNETAADAINIGNLDRESVIVSISDQGTTPGSGVYTRFMSPTGFVSLEQFFSSYTSKIYTQYKLYDDFGTVIADSEGTAEQQAAYTKWVAGNLMVNAGNYTATATPNTNVIGDVGLTAASSEQQGTSLQVNSSLTGSDTSEYYNFSLYGSDIKLDFNAATIPNTARIVLTDIKGKIVADSGGNAHQKANYASLTSGTGLSASAGDYTIKVTYADNTDTTKELKYTMKLYSGNSYSAVYNKTVKAQPYDGSAAGSVTADSKAKLYETTAYNKIKVTAATAINIGWMQQDKSMLDVYSQLTSADNADYFSFTFEQGDNLKFGFNAKTTTKASGLRVQLMDNSGTYVIADSEGTAAQREAYQELTTTNGLKAKTGVYVVKISYAAGAAKNDSPYEFGIYSGSTYVAKYKTTASAETFATALLLGEVGGKSASTGIAAYLVAEMNDDDTSTSLTDALKSYF